MGSLASLVNISAGKEIVKSGVTGVSKQPQVWESIYRGLRTTPALGNEIKEVVCPAFADSISEGDVRWEKQVGDSVAEDDVLCEIETDKTSVPVPSPAAGAVAPIPTTPPPVPPMPAAPKKVTPPPAPMP